MYQQDTHDLDLSQTNGETPDAHESTATFIPDSNEKKTADLINEDDPARIARSKFIKGKYPSHERIRIVRPSKKALESISPGLLKATDELLMPPAGGGRVLYYIKRALIGMPLANSEAEHERLPKFKALAVLSSDAISSVAYATETCMSVLILSWPLLIASCLAHQYRDYYLAGNCRHVIQPDHSGLSKWWRFIHRGKR